MASMTGRGFWEVAAESRYTRRTPGDTSRREDGKLRPQALDVELRPQD